VAQPKSAVEKNQHSDKDEEIHRHQPSSPAATSRCPFTQTLPLTFLEATVARAWAMADAVVVGVTVMVALAVVVAMAVVIGFHPVYILPKPLLSGTNPMAL
jgi:hypothetical protein